MKKGDVNLGWVIGAFAVLIALFILVLAGVSLSRDVEGNKQSFFGGLLDLFPSKQHVMDRFNEYFDDTFSERYKDCRNSDNTSCFCMDDEFEIPNNYFVKFASSGDSVNVVLLNQDKREFEDSSYYFAEINPCLIINSDKIPVGEDGILVSSDSKVLYGENEEEVDLSLLFYKPSQNEICVINKQRAQKLKKNICE